MKRIAKIFADALKLLAHRRAHGKTPRCPYCGSAFTVILKRTELPHRCYEDVFLCETCRRGWYGTIFQRDDADDDGEDLVSN